MRSLENPWKRAGLTLDCAANPLDVRPVARGVLRLIKTLGPSATPERPLVILLSECHSIPAHLLVQYLVVEQLSAWRRGGDFDFAVGFEKSHNVVERFADSLLASGLPEALHGKLLPLDVDGGAALAGEIAYGNAALAPITSAHLANMCLRRKVAVRFNDAAHRGGYLDVRDEATSRFAKRGPEDDLIDMVEVEGMAIRNRMIVANAMEHMRASGVSIYLQFCGASHVAGHTAKGFPYATSLDNLFTREGALVVPVMYDQFIDKGIPALGGVALARGIAVKNLSRKQYESDNPVGEETQMRLIASESGISLIEGGHEELIVKSAGLFRAKIGRWASGTGTGDAAGALTLQ